MTRPEKYAMISPQCAPQVSLCRARYLRAWAPEEKENGNMDKRRASVVSVNDIYMDNERNTGDNNVGGDKGQTAKNS